VSAARRARAATVAAHKARGTYVERRPRDMAVDTFMAHARVPRDRESVFSTAIDLTGLSTNQRKPSADSHQPAPEDGATPGCNVSPNALYAD